MANLAAAVSFFDPELMAIGFDRLDAWIAETPSWRSSPLRRPAAPAPGARPLRRGGGGAGADLRPLRRHVQHLQHAEQRGHDLPTRDRLRRRATGGGPGQHRRAGHPSRPRGAPQRVGELRRRLPGVQEHPCGHANDRHQAGRLQRAGAGLRLGAARLAGA